ncbi:MAG: hypothetical protein LBD21_06640 [Tannerellaceae bacterium]|jgi:hypothetical protein|nr:hypothetical protein [Tannerellaceae bacterium]
MLLKEILRKEEEKHRLKFIGIVTDWEDTMKRTAKAFAPGPSFAAEHKAKLLHCFYSSILAYNNFIRREKFRNANLKRHHFMKTATYVLRLRNAPADGLDGELKTGAAITLAYHLSPSLYEAIYTGFCDCETDFASPQEADDFFAAGAAAGFPLDVARLVERLSVDDASFWELLARYLKDLAYAAVNYYLQKADDSGYSEIIRDDTWTNAYEILRRRFVLGQGNVPVFESGRDFRNYIITVCKKLSANLYRKYCLKQELSLSLSYPPGSSADDEADSPVREQSTFDLPEDEDGEPSDDFALLDINPDNPYEVAHAVSIILLNSAHPLHSRLIAGIEDKVRILIDKATNGMSYNEIISELYGERNMSREEFQRAVVKARKDYERVRKLLFERLTGLIKKTSGAVTIPASSTYYNKKQL